MERFVALLTWIALAVVLIAALFARHEPQRPDSRPTGRRADNDRAAAS
jgi:hypothetical protein